MVIRDRQTLSRDGLVMIVVQIDRQSGALVGAPEILARGVARNRHTSDILADVREEISRVVADQEQTGATEDPTYLSRQLRESVSAYLFGKTRRRPLVLPVVLEV
jgi:ribonuclease J